MALSTSIPMPRARPPKVMLLRVKPLKYISPKVATIEIGMAVAMIEVLERLRRKRSRMTIASRPPKRVLLATELIDCLIKTDESKLGVILICGRSRLMRSISLLTASATSTVLEPDCLLMAMRRPALPLRRLRERTSCQESSTFATSLIRIGVPWRVVMTVLRISSRLTYSPWVRIWISRLPFLKRPAGMVRFSLRRALMIALVDSPRALS
ncbi:MAG: hypothetical protein BWY77_01122 [bacterium ADurb.Bin431]|nr:MAG: hypothetical protein BWY77_01122 [bacterium ADurb.Bin431]